MGQTKKAPGLISFLLFVYFVVGFVFGFVFTRPGFFFCCCSSLCCKAHPSGIWSRPKKHPGYSQFLTETVMRPFLALPNSSLSFLPFCHFNSLAVSVENRNQIICHQKVFFSSQNDMKAMFDQHLIRISIQRHRSSDL